jgi:glycosyltransferase involved in cell wall biosynthesis
MTEPNDIWLLIDSRSVGGIERHVATLAASLRQRGKNATVILYQDHGPNAWYDQLGRAGVPYQCLGGKLTALLSAIRRDQPDLVHTHGYKAGVLGRVAARLCGTPVVSTFHSGEKAPFPVSFYYWLDDWTSVLGQRIAVSREIQKRLPWPSGVIPSFVVPGTRQATGQFSNKVGFVGRLSHEKGPDIFCEIARACPPGLEWHVWGDGSMRAELEKSYGDLVTFHGIVSDIAPVLASIGLLVMPSRYEGLPLAALEALSAGVPVLASAVGGVPTAVGPGTGWLIEPGAIGPAVAAIEQWRRLDEADAERMRAACCKHVSENFSEHSIIPHILMVYSECVSRNWRSSNKLRPVN